MIFWMFFELFLLDLLSMYRHDNKNTKNTRSKMLGHPKYATGPLKVKNHQPSSSRQYVHSTTILFFIITTFHPLQEI